MVVVVHPRNKSGVWVEPTKNQGLEERAGIIKYWLKLNIWSNHNVNRSQLAFTPRVLSKSSTTKGQAAAKLQPMKFVKPAAVKEKEAGKADGEGANANGNGTAPKSNSDFRSMFLK